MIKVETTLSKDMDLINYSRKLDELCKRILSNKIILSWIMKNCMEEYKNCEISDIAGNYIEGMPQVAKVVVNRDERSCDSNAAERIHGENTEDSTVTEGKITYDIRFCAIIPDTEEQVYLIINIEAQDDFYPGYPIIKRGIYHCSRMISAQYGIEFTNSHYENIKKVYSVWICTDPPDYRKNTITEYSMSEKNIIGNVKEKTENYDLLTAVMICLGGSEYENYYGILKLLDVIFSTELLADEKRQILQNEFNIEMTKELESGVQEMCDFGAGVVKRGIEKGLQEGLLEGLQEGLQKGMQEGMQKGEIKGKKLGIVQSITNLMKTMNLNLEQAMDVLLIPEQDRKEYSELL